MAKAKFKINKTGKTFEGTFEGTVFTTVTDAKGVAYKINVPDPDISLVQHLPSDTPTL